MGSVLTPPRTPSPDEKLDWSPKMGVVDRFLSPALNMVQLLILAPLYKAGSIFSSGSRPAPTTTTNSKPRPTAWLDGLRGFAAVLVYIAHHELWAHMPASSDKVIENGFGYEGRYYFISLPFIRLFFGGGHFAVSIFFTISGYVLSLKPLMLIRDTEYLKLGDNISSALFRRWIRLWIPILASTFLYMNLVWLYPHSQNVMKPEFRYLSELYRWYDDMKQTSFIFKTGGIPWSDYNFHIWTIPLEFKGSIVVYTSVMAFSRARTNARLLLTCGLMFYFMYIVDGWYCTCFLGGMLLAELDLLAERENLPELFSKFEPYKDLIFTTLFVIGLYFGGVPSAGDIKNIRGAWGWHYLSYLIPSAVFMHKQFFLAIAGFLMVASIPRLPAIKSFFELPLNVWFGKISFALYLVHGPILWTLADHMYAAVGWVRLEHMTTCPKWIGIFRLPDFGIYGLELNFLVAQLIIFPFTLWVATIATRFLDDPAIRIAGTLYKKVLPEHDEPADRERHPV